MSPTLLLAILCVAFILAALLFRASRRPDAPSRRPPDAPPPRAALSRESDAARQLRRRVEARGWTFATPDTPLRGDTPQQLTFDADGVTLRAELHGHLPAEDAPPGAQPVVVTASIPVEDADLWLHLELSRDPTPLPGITPRQPRLSKHWLNLSFTGEAPLEVDPAAVLDALPRGEDLAQLARAPGALLRSVHVEDSTAHLTLACVAHLSADALATYEGVAFETGTYERRRPLDTPQPAARVMRGDALRAAPRAEVLDLLDALVEAAKATRALGRPSQPERLAANLVLSHGVGEARLDAASSLCVHAAAGGALFILRDHAQNPLEHPEETILWSTVEPAHHPLDAAALNLLLYAPTAPLSPLARELLASAVAESVGLHEGTRALLGLKLPAVMWAPLANALLVRSGEQEREALLARLIRHAAREGLTPLAGLITRTANDRALWHPHHEALAALITERVAARGPHTSDLDVVETLRLTACFGALSRWLEQRESARDSRLRARAEQLVVTLREGAAPAGQRAHPGGSDNTTTRTPDARARAST